MASRCLLLACGCLAALAPSGASGEKTGGKGVVQLGKKWWSLGPFASGKVEYDGDPLEAYGGALSLFERGPGAAAAAKGGTKLGPGDWGSFLAEHAVGGKVAWKAVQAEVDRDGYSHVALPHSHVPFQALMGRPPLGGSTDVLHVQHWVFGSLKVKTPGRFAIDCRGLHTFSVARAGENSSVGPFAGNIYRRSDPLATAAVDLPEAGLYRLLSRVRGKAPLQFSCGARLVDRPLVALVDSRNLPDVVLGSLIAGSSVIDVRVKNLGAEWMDVSAEVVEDSPRKQRVRVQGRSERVHLAPGAAAQLPLPISAEGERVEREKTGCAHFEVAVAGNSSSGAATTLRVQASLRCRKSTQSALLTFLDVDGSVGTAAVLRPRGRPGDPATAGPMPIVVSMSGVGVEPQQQADAYKMKPTPDDPGDYTFGFEGLWVLVPQRGGPHNWEDVGMRTALRAIDVLAAAAEAPGADASRLVVHGHSRGGHGAWGLATRIPDRVLGVASACGWYSREEYGDANNLWVHETSLMHMDKVLLGILHGSVAANENSLHASNLRGTRALVRVGSRDTSVPPWFGRRMARHMAEEGVNVTFEEFDQEHWWWDSKQTNDGGVMHDKAMRDWTLAVAEAGPASLLEALAGGELTIAASSPEYEGRFGLRILQLSSPASRGFIRARHSEVGLRLRTANVQRFAVAGGSEVARAMVGVASVDGARVAFDAAVGAEFCRGGAAGEQAEDVCGVGAGDGGAACGGAGRSGGSWQVCTTSTGAPPRSRGLPLLGPIRRTFAAPWVVVVPDEPSALEVRLAAYFTSGHLTAYEAATQALPLSRAAPLRSTHRFVWLGEAHRLPPDSASGWPVQISRGGDEGASFSLGPCTFGGGHGAAFLAPAGPALGPAADGMLDLVVTGADAKALEDLVTFSFATNQEHTRAPFSNMLPDFFVTGPDFRWRGYGGVAAAGYWDADWRVSASSSYLQC